MEVHLRIETTQQNLDQLKYWKEFWSTEEFYCHLDSKEGHQQVKFMGVSSWCNG